MHSADHFTDTWYTCTHKTKCPYTSWKKKKPPSCNLALPCTGLLESLRLNIRAEALQDNQAFCVILLFSKTEFLCKALAVLKLAL